jgi:CheY-like chemotaxis protein
MASLPHAVAGLPATRPFQGQRQRVLVVDDEVSFAAVMGEVLDAFGLHVDVAHDAKDALHKMELNPPDLMLVDVMMPEVDGLSLIRKIQAEPAWQGIPIVVISARASTSDKNEAMFAGADAFLGKPFTADELREALRRHLPRDPRI